MNDNCEAGLIYLDHLVIGPVALALAAYPLAVAVMLKVR